MIKEISIYNIIPYNHESQNIKPKQVNFIFGLNGSGKTTFSKVIAKHDSIYKDNCDIIWTDHPIKCFVYNKYFIKENFSESSAPGIFTLGKKNIEINKKISDIENEIRELHDQNFKLNNTLAETSTKIQNLNNEYSDKFWKEKQRIDKEDHEFIPYLEGVRNSKEAFKNRLLEEYKNNNKKLLAETELKKLCGQLNKGNAEKFNPINTPPFENLHPLEDDEIFRRKITGRDDSEIAGLIKKLNNEGWFKEGVQYTTKSEGTCPFCQRPLEKDFLAKVKEYFDESYAETTKMLNKSYQNYLETTKKILASIDSIVSQYSNFIELDAFAQSAQNIKDIITKNQTLLERKIKSPDISIQMLSTKDCARTISELIDKANQLIENHNKRIDNIKSERLKLIAQVWRCTISRLEGDITSYSKSLKSLIHNKSKILDSITANNNDISNKKKILSSLHAQTSSIHPTAEKINNYLLSGGITSFKLEVEDKTNRYKFIRNDGKDTDDTLSEGEQNLVTFLYFFCSLEGNKEQNTQSEDKVVIIDDPVSSLDSNILFFVSTLIRTLFKEIYSGTGKIKQLFILSHNSFFFREVSYERGLAPKKTTYCVISKTKNQSNITQLSSNPVKSTYEMLWREIRNAKTNPSSCSNISIANTMRRILEYYFSLLGNIDLSEDVFNELPPEDKVVYKSLMAWLNSSSHAAFEDYSVEAFTVDVEKYLSVFEKVFELTHHTAHYSMMMNPPQKK